MDTQWHRKNHGGKPGSSYPLPPISGKQNINIDMYCLVAEELLVDNVSEISLCFVFIELDNVGQNNSTYNRHSMAEGGCRGHNRMVVGFGFATTCAISAYHH